MPNYAYVARPVDPHDPSKGYTVQVEDNDVRLLLAIGFCVLFGLTVLLCVWLTLGNSDPAKIWPTTKDLLGVVLPAETGLLGSILGFYFGSKSPTKTVSMPDVSPAGSSNDNN